MPSAYDVIILGGGYTGNLAAIVLRRKGYSVAVIEGAAFPRFAIGESTTPEQNRLHAWLANRYDIPELLSFSSYPRLKADRLPLPTWPKESFYFLMKHGAPGAHSGQAQEIMHQATTWPVGPDYHMLRADFDQYMLSLAERYGAHVWGVSKVQDLTLEPGHVTCTIQNDSGLHVLRGRFFVDTSGHGAFLASRLGLVMKDPPHVTLRSRTIYNHFIGVKKLEETFGRNWPSIGVPRDNSTLHNIWPEAWSWTIPFDNGVTSVGIVLNMDRDRLDHQALTPAEAFWEMARRNPAFAAMMKDARPIRPWARTERLQWQASTSVGDSWVLLPPANGFSDPLLSPGMASAAAAVARLGEGIDAILREGVDPREALAKMEASWQIEAEYIPRLLHCLFLSFHHYDLFRETLTIFRMGTQLSGMNLRSRTERSFLDPLWGFAFPEIRALVDKVHHTLSSGLMQKRADSALAAEVHQLIEAHDQFGFLRAGLTGTRRTGIYLNYLPAMVRWATDLQTSDGRSVWHRHIAKVAMRAVIPPRSTFVRWKPPTALDLGQMALRQLKLTFSRGQVEPAPSVLMAESSSSDAQVAAVVTATEAQPRSGT